MNILVSACLIGTCCRYDGDHQHNQNVVNLAEKHVLIPICPEQLGGLMTPRPPAELRNGRVITNDGIDVTKQFIAGAKAALDIARLNNCKQAILKEHSPSCGCGKIYDGSFSGNLVNGVGITADLLLQNGISVIGEKHVDLESL